MNATNSFGSCTTKREPTPTEQAILTCAKAIDALELAITAQTRAFDRMIVVLEAIEKREHWVDEYRSDEHALEALRGL